MDTYWQQTDGGKEKKIPLMEGIGITDTYTLAEGSDTMEAGEETDADVESKTRDEESLIAQLREKKVKFSENDVLGITRMPDGKIVWLEHGNKSAGLNHIMEAHGEQFAEKGIDGEDELVKFILLALSQGERVCRQGSSGDRWIYKVPYHGQDQWVAITVGSNGFIVGANPSSEP